MRGYFFTLFKRQLQRGMAYRINWFFGLLGSFLSLFIQVAIWQALYRGAPAVVAGATLADMVTYAIITSVVGAVTHANFLFEVGGFIRDGSVSTRLIRPIDFRMGLLAENVGRTIGGILLHTLPAVLVAALAFGLKPPASAIHAVGFAFFLLGAACLNYLFQFALGYLCFWFISPTLPNSSTLVLSYLFSGRLVPLWFFPDAIQNLAGYMPYRFLYFVPASIYLGKISPQEFAGLAAILLFWIAVLFGLERLLWSLGLRKLVIQGG